MSDTPIPTALLSAERLAEIRRAMQVGSVTARGKMGKELWGHIAALQQEIDVRKRYGHFCCTTHATAALAEKRDTGIGPWENIGFSTARISNK